jgi:hypothetical protein
MGAVDDFLVNLKQPDLLAGDAQKAAAILQDARGNWGAAMRAEDLGVRLTRAERQAAHSGSGSNIDNSIRQKVSAVLDVPSRSAGYSPEEIAQAEKVVRGTPTGNALRKVGKLGVSDGLSLLLHAGAAIPTGGASIPVAVAGTMARKASEAITSGQAARLDTMLRQRSPAYAAAQAALAVPAPQRTLLQQRLIEAALARPSTSSAGQAGDGTNLLNR